MRSLTFIMLLAPALLFGCKESTAPAKESKPQEAVSVTLAPTRVGSIERTVEVIGTLYGDEETVLSAKVPGRVTEIFKDVVDRVNEGEALAQIEKTDYELSVAQAQMAQQQTLAKLGLTELPDEKFDPAQVPTVQQKRLQAANAEARFKRAEQLFEKKPPLISEQDYADQKTTFEVARSEAEVAMLEAKALLAEVRSKQSDLKIAEQRLADATIRTPRLGSSATTQPGTGRFGVAARMASIGEYVREGTAMFRLVADSVIKYRASVPERFSGQIKVGQRTTVSIESVNQPFEGKVTRINPQIDQATRSFQVEVLVPNPTGQLRPGAFARGSMTINGM